MMIDIRGFTPFAATVPPKAVVDMLTSFHARIIPIVRANGGVIDKFLGDGVMATFGAAARVSHGRRRCAARARSDSRRGDGLAELACRGAA